MFLWGQGDIKRCACVWSRVVQICGVLPRLSYELLAAPQGACCARKRPAKDGPGENRITAWSFKHPRTQVIKFSAPFPLVKQKHVSGNTLVTSYPKIRNKDDKNFTPKMTFFQTLEIFFESWMCSKSLVTNWTNKQKRVQLERLESRVFIGGWDLHGFHRSDPSKDKTKFYGTLLIRIEARLSHGSCSRKLWPSTSPTNHWWRSNKDGIVSNN